jgi:CubicO group peptidase (beta-lactamase class C family)
MSETARCQRCGARDRLRPKAILAGSVILALAFGVPLACVSGPGSTLNPASPAIDTRQLDSLLSRTAAEWDSGCSLLLVQGHKVLYEQSFGRFDPRKPLRIASATKWLTAAVVLRLADEGRLSLDDPAARYLPGFAGDKARITIRQLLSHMSGLPIAGPMMERRDITLEQAVDAIAQLPLMSAPGEACVYGDVSVQVAGRIAEIAGGLQGSSGRIWKELFRTKLTDPLEMTQTSSEGVAPTDNPHLAGGAISTVQDYANFLTMLLDGGEFRGRRILAAASIGEMFRDQTGGRPFRFNPFQLFPELCPGWRDVRYGLCTWLERTDVVSGLGREASAPGVFGFCPWVDFDLGLAGVFASEAGMDKAFPVYLKLKSLIKR